MKTILHIAPTLPPEINGLGDFCKILSCNLERKGYTDQRFLLRRSSAAGNHVLIFGPHDFYQKLSTARPDVIVLHYVGYAYDPYGLPFYLLHGLYKHRKLSRCRLLIFFHELYASSTSALKLPFYTKGLQKLIVKKLFAMADAAFTSCGTYSRLLSRMGSAGKSKTVCTGIFSNIPDNLFNDQATREVNSMVVFGSKARRLAVYRHPKFASTLDALDVRQLYDVGPGAVSFAHPRVSWYTKGALTVPDLADCLNKVNFGALCYKPHLLAKSGIFSAYAAFGVIPINLLAADEGLDDGLIDGLNYVSGDDHLRHEFFVKTDVRQELLRWYSTHNQYEVAEKIMMHM